MTHDWLMKTKMNVLLKLLFLLSSLLLPTLVLLSYLSRSLLWPLSNECDMSFMFQVPKFIEVDDMDGQSEVYKLYHYTETERSRSWSALASSLSGQPVLFLPGNAGSFRQMRSLASIALRKHLSSGPKTHPLEVFGVDLDQEYSAIYGGNLNEQANFTARCIEHLISMYNNRSHHVNVVIVGHSIGGLVAMKAMGMLEHSDINRVGLLITLATPHSPIALLDGRTELFYRDIHTLWTSEREGSFKHLATISIGGGPQDLQVRSEVISSPFMDLTISSATSMNVWRSADHLCILWCRQLVLTLTRALFDVQLLDEREERLRVFDYHFNKGNAGKSYAHYMQLVNAKWSIETGMKSGKWKSESGLRRQLSYSETSPIQDDEDVHLLLPLFADEHHEVAVVDLLLENNVHDQSGDWLTGCLKMSNEVVKETKMGSKVATRCVQGRSLTANNTRSTPIMDSFRSFDIRDGVRRPDERVRYTAILYDMALSYEAIVVSLKRGMRARLSVDFFRRSDRSISVDQTFYFTPTNLTLPVVPKGGLLLNITMPHLDLVWPAYELKLFFKVDKCSDPDAMLATIPHLAVIRNDDSKHSVSLRLELTRMRRRLGERERPTLTLLLRCPLERVQVQSDFLAMGNNLALIYFPMLPSALLVALIASVTSGVSASTTNLTQKTCSELPLLLIVAILSHTLSYLLPSNDLEALRSRGHYFWQLQLMLLSSAFGLQLTLRFIVTTLLGIVSRVVVVMCPRGLLHPFLASGILLVLAMAACGSLSLVLNALLFLVMMASRSQRQVELKVSLLLLFLLVAMLNIPSALAFLNHRFDYDPSRLLAVAMALFLPVFTADVENNVHFVNTFKIVNVSLCVISSLFAAIHLYRVSHLVVVFLLCLTIFKVNNNNNIDSHKKVK